MKKKTKFKTTDKKRQARTRPNVTAGVRRSRLLVFLVAGFTRATAARAAGVCTRTVDRWTADPAFRIELESARRSAFDDALGGIRGAAARAVETLSVLLRSKREATRRLAATDILGFAFRAHSEGEIEERISALEKKAREISNRDGAVN